MRKTKIVATIGPATDSVVMLERLIGAGMNVARINFSHGDHESHFKTVQNIKQARKNTGLPVAIMLDTKGPEIRLGTFAGGDVQLVAGDTFTLTTEDVAGDKTRVSVDYKDLPRDLIVGARVLVDDGLISLRVKEISGSDIICTVENSGELGNRKGVNLPDSQVNLPAITEKDIDDIKFGIAHGLDFLAASFVRSAKDVLEIRQILEDNGGSGIAIIAKIENREGVDNIESILEVVDGIMVARGDLGVEIPPEEVPLVQKQLIKMSNLSGKPVITATQMLESMISNPRPTRAEANDVANAIYDGSDAIMLSGETAKGAYPIEAVELMDRIARKSEDGFDYNIHLNYRRRHNVVNVTNAITYATCATADDLKAACIITPSQTGFTARMVSKFRPKCTIIAMAHDVRVWRQMSLVWGVVPYLPPMEIHDGNIFELSTKASQDTGIAKVGDLVVVTAGLPIGVASSTNMMRVQVVGDVLARGIGHVNDGQNVIVGKTFVAKPSEDIMHRIFQEGDILVATTTDESMIGHVRKAGAVIVGSDLAIDHTHAQIACQALRKPLLICNIPVINLIHSDITVSIDLADGFVYNGIITK